MKGSSIKKWWWIKARKIQRKNKKDKIRKTKHWRRRVEGLTRDKSRRGGGKESKKNDTPWLSFR